MHLHGSNLIEKINTVAPKEALVEGLLYKKSSHMLFAPDGIGKSQITLQIMMQGTSSNALVFNSFLVPNGFKVLSSKQNDIKTKHLNA